MQNENIKRVKIKICGLRRPEDVQMVNQYRPDFCGFICSEPFWRYVPEDTLRELSAAVNPAIVKVGVFVDDDPEREAAFARDGLIDVIQLHGKEGETEIQTLRKALLSYGKCVPVIKAFRVACREDVRKAAQSSADYVLLDGGTGSGRAFDWSLIRDIERDYFLAGGLDPDNIEEAAKRFRPYAVDISSGVETEKRKDPDKIRKCVEAVRRVRR